MYKYGRAGQSTDDNITWRMRCTWRITKARTQGQTIFNTCCFSWQQTSRERVTMLHYTTSPVLYSRHFSHQNIYTFLFSVRKAACPTPTTHHEAVFSSRHFISPEPCSQTLSVNLLPWMWHTNFHDHAKQSATFWFRAFQYLMALVNRQ